MFEPKTPTKSQYNQFDEIPAKQVYGNVTPSQNNNFSVFSSQDSVTKDAGFEPSTPSTENFRPRKRNGMSIDLNLPPRKKPKKKKHIPKVVKDDIKKKKISKSTEKSSTMKGAKRERGRKKPEISTATVARAESNGKNQCNSVKCSLKFDLDGLGHSQEGNSEKIDNFLGSVEAKAQDVDSSATLILDKYTLFENFSLPTRRQLIRGNLKCLIVGDACDPSTIGESKHKGVWGASFLGINWGRKASRTTKHRTAKGNGNKTCASGHKCHPLLPPSRCREPCVTTCDERKASELISNVFHTELNGFIIQVYNSLLPLPRNGPVSHYQYSNDMFPYVDNNEHANMSKYNIYGSGEGLQERRASIYGRHHSSTTLRGYTGSLEIVPHMNHPLDDMIKRKDYPRKRGRIMVPTNLHSALVPYNGDSQIVPYKRRGYKNKKELVDIDKRTEEMWNFLTSGIANDGDEVIGKESEMWWSKEREWLCGKTNTFLARMNAMQGNRRFSPWNGTVLDSIIGVFLTQNATDCASSSSFINLASRFPPKKTSNDDRQEASLDKKSNLSGNVQPEMIETCQGESEQSIEPVSFYTEPEQSINIGQHTSSLISSHDKMTNTSKMDGKSKKKKDMDIDWDELRKEVYIKHGIRDSTTVDLVDWEAVRCADENEIIECIRKRGQYRGMTRDIKAFLNRAVKDHGSLNLEWLKDVPPDKAEKYLLSIHGLGAKSVGCLRLLALNQTGFPVDTNVARIAVRLGWVRIKPLPEALPFHRLEKYPEMKSIQKFLWPRICILPRETLLDLHYVSITFGKNMCTMSKPNCKECPMKGECKHYASAVSEKLSLPCPEEKGKTSPSVPCMANQNSTVCTNSIFALPEPEKGGINSICDLPELEKGGINSIVDMSELEKGSNVPFETSIMPTDCNPLIEEPSSPETEYDEMRDIEDSDFEDRAEMCLYESAQNVILPHMNKFGDVSKVLAAYNTTSSLTPTPKFSKNLRTEHQAYELPDSHPLIEELELEKRVDKEACPYLLAIWTPGEIPDSSEQPETCCHPQSSENLCNEGTCFSCKCEREVNSQIVRGTLLIPCRTTMRGCFPLSGSYFQVNQVFADDETSRNPINVPMSSLWNLNKRIVYFAKRVQSVFRGRSIQDIQSCTREGYICLHGFNRKTRTCHDLVDRLHFSAAKKGKGIKSTNVEKKAKKNDSASL